MATNSRLNIRLRRLEELLSVRTERNTQGHVVDWLNAQDRLLDALPSHQRAAVIDAIEGWPDRGLGLLDWLDDLVRASSIPTPLPSELVQVYLDDPDALPLHDCEDCGLRIPVRPGRQCGNDSQAAHRYFDHCPACGGRVGWYAFWEKHKSNKAEGTDG